ncbi:MAG: hypothetical protein KAR05_09570 [Candidatus Omnitrophica bacterium]|nr:hypothetical protein [Candidatus Omnitrophota bacterium]
MTELTQDNFSVMNYLKIFFRRKQLLIIPAFMGLVIGICAGILLPKEFKSSTVILVEEGKTDNPLFQELAVSTTVRQRLTSIREAMLGWNSIVKLINRLELDKEVKTTKQFEHLVNGIRDNIEIDMKGHNVMYLSYVGFDPAQTQLVVQNITDIFIERNKEIQNQETTDAIAFITEQLRVYKGKIKSSEIARLQEQLEELLVDSTEKHPIVKQLRERINLKMGELKQEDLEFTEAESLKLENNSPLIDSIKSALENIEDSSEKLRAVPYVADNEMYKVMLLEKLDKVMARDEEVNSSIYNVLLQRLETAKITKRLQASKEGTRYTIVEPPRIPLDAFKPDKIVVALSGLFMGVLLGLCLVVATEFLDKSFIDVEDAKEFLGVPLLGAISKINTENSIRHERDKERWIYSLTFVAGVAIILVTITISTLFK